MPRTIFRHATGADLPALIRLMDEDEIGAQRDPVITTIDDHVTALRTIDADPNNRLIVADRDGMIVGTFQITFIPGNARRGNLQGMIESVRVAAAHRGSGLGTPMMEWAVGQCRAHGCPIVQLTSDMERRDAHRFYERLGFSATHAGFKLPL